MFQQFSGTITGLQNLLDLHIISNLSNYVLDFGVQIRLFIAIKISIS